ncbi:hypothetical protein DIPPA_27361 [Diplonema papillatum]|nr:hypothetical protein DIPPA_27361 [Diplonema papillatum]
MTLRSFLRVCVGSRVGWTQPGAAHWAAFVGRGCWPGVAALAVECVGAAALGGCVGRKGPPQHAAAAAPRDRSLAPANNKSFTMFSSPFTQADAAQADAAQAAEAQAAEAQAAEAQAAEAQAAEAQAAEAQAAEAQAAEAQAAEAQAAEAQAAEAQAAEAQAAEAQAAEAQAAEAQAAAAQAAAAQADAAQAAAEQPYLIQKFKFYVKVSTSRTLQLT